MMLKCDAIATKKKVEVWMWGVEGWEGGLGELLATK